jgi:hypothetical protein
MPHTGGGTVPDTMIPVRPHVLLVAVAQGSSCPGKEAQRCRQSLQQPWRQRAAKFEQHTSLGIDARRLQARKPM